VVESHDHTLLIGGARLMIKQAAIRSARRLLAEWGRAAGLGGEWWDYAPEYRAAKAELLGQADAAIAQRVATGLWVKEAWSEYTAREFSGEEADVIASHFQTGGVKQRRLMDWYLGEFVQFYYTFTDRFDYEVMETRDQLSSLQKEALARIPTEDVNFSSRNPEAFAFIACSPDGPYCPGLQYWKMLAIPLLGALPPHGDTSADRGADARAPPRGGCADRAFKARTKAGPPRQPGLTGSARKPDRHEARMAVRRALRCLGLPCAWIDPAPRRVASRAASGGTPSTIKGGNVMTNPLDSLWGTVIAGLVITLVLYVVVRLAIGG
jgi:hypothetical protein